MPVYLDFNASAPLRDAAWQAMEQVYHQQPGNAASGHGYGRRAREAIEQARAQVAGALGVRPRDVVFTSGATEADNLAVLGLAPWGRANGRTHILCSAIEHPAVLGPCRHLADQGYDVEFVSPDENGVVPAEEFLARLRPDTLLCCLMHANNETGAIQPVEAVARGVMAGGSFFHVDAAQSFGRITAAVAALPAHTLSISAHKLGGPQGIGALVFKDDVRPPLSPLHFGGGQEGGLRPGTLPAALIAGFGAAVAEAARDEAAETAACEDTGRWVREQLQEVDHRILSSAVPCLPNTMYVQFPGVPAELLTRLAGRDCAFGTGSACASIHGQASPVLLAMGVSAEDALCTVRFSWGPRTGRPDLRAVVMTIRQLQM